MNRALVAVALLLAAGGTRAAEPAPAPAPDYADAANWLCRPGRADVCSAPLSVATVAADGAVSTAALPTAATPKVDCFYVYPTVSTDPGPNSDMTADAAERNVATIQFAPFRGVCRTFAPLYRQVTLAALRSALSGGPPVGDRVLAYLDIAAAWRSYMAHDNNGRGVILIGHSQGAGLLRALIQHEIDGRPDAGRVIAAYLAGTNIAVPPGKAVGGDFKATPLCTAATQTGCVVTWVSFRDDTVPPADTRFGKVADTSMLAGCVNPAALGGGRGALMPMLPNRRDIVDDSSAQPAWSKGKTITADFVALPGLLTAECRSAAGANYLAVRTEPTPGSLRTDRIGGDVVAGGKIRPEWGLHLIDISEALGNLTALAASQSAAWLAAHP